MTAGARQQEQWQKREEKEDEEEEAAAGARLGPGKETKQLFQGQRQDKVSQGRTQQQACSGGGCTDPALIVLLPLSPSRK